MMMMMMMIMMMTIIIDNKCTFSLNVVIISFFHINRQSQSIQKGKNTPQSGILIDTIHIHIKTSFAFVANDF